MHPLNIHRRLQNITFLGSFFCKPGLDSSILFFTTFSVQFRHVTYIAVYVGMVENTGEMLVVCQNRQWGLVVMSRATAGLFIL